LVREKRHAGSAMPTGPLLTGEGGKKGKEKKRRKRRRSAALPLEGKKGRTVSRRHPLLAWGKEKGREEKRGGGGGLSGGGRKKKGRRRKKRPPGFYLSFHKKKKEEKREGGGKRKGSGGGGGEREGGEGNIFISITLGGKGEKRGDTRPPIGASFEGKGGKEERKRCLPELKHPFP